MVVDLFVVADIAGLGFSVLFLMPFLRCCCSFVYFLRCFVSIVTTQMLNLPPSNCTLSLISSFRRHLVPIERLVDSVLVDLGEGGGVFGDVDDGFGLAFRRTASRRRLQPMHVLRAQFWTSRHRSTTPAHSYL